MAGQTFLLIFLGLSIAYFAPIVNRVLKNNFILKIENNISIN